MVAKDESGGYVCSFAFTDIVYRRVLNIDYGTIEEDLGNGALQQRLRQELERGFREIHERGEPLPVPSHYASRIAEIIYANSEREIPKEMAFDLYQEVLLACEQARAAVLGEELRSGE